MNQKGKHQIYNAIKNADRVIDECQLSVDSVYLDLLSGKMITTALSRLHGQFRVS